MQRTLRGARLFTGERMLDGHAVVVDGDRIAALVPEEDAATGEDLPDGSLLVPGFIDLQVNGAGGVLFNDSPTEEAALAIAAAVRRRGTTGVLPTFITDERGKLERACDAAARARARASGVLGVHLEGPFINPDRAGVHAREWIRAPDAADIDLLTRYAQGPLAGGLLLTLAPECVDDGIIAQLSAAGIVIAAGHTAATVERTHQALASGVRGFTHLFNAMPPVVNRQPGPVAAALADRESWCGVIADGIHVHPALLQLLLRIKPGKVILVTDAMPPCGTDAVTFQLYGQTIHRRDGRLVTDDGTLAGADLDMPSAVRHCVDHLGLSLEESLRMASLYPARVLGLDGERGRLAPGQRADLTLLAPDLTVLATWVGGEVQWESDPPS